MHTKLIHSKLTEKVLGCAIKAHRNLGSGFLEKAEKKFEDIHYATVLSQVRASRLPVALSLNFNSPTLSIRRFANSVTRLNAEAQKSGGAEEVNV